MRDFGRAPDLCTPPVGQYPPVLRITCVNHEQTIIVACQCVSICRTVRTSKPLHTYVVHASFVAVFNENKLPCETHGQCLTQPQQERKCIALLRITVQRIKPQVTHLDSKFHTQLPKMDKVKGKRIDGKVVAITGKDIQPPIVKIGQSKTLNMRP